jgi:hypothetical protein
VTHLRKMMLEELERRNYSEGTTRRYLRFVERFAQHFGKSPDKLGPDHLRSPSPTTPALWGVISYGESGPRRSQILNIAIKTVAFCSPLQWGPTFGALVELWYTSLDVGPRIEERFLRSRNSAASGEGLWGSPMIWR